MFGFSVRDPFSLSYVLEFVGKKVFQTYTVQSLSDSLCILSPSHSLYWYICLTGDWSIVLMDDMFVRATLDIIAEAALRTPLNTLNGENEVWSVYVCCR